MRSSTWHALGNTYRVVEPGDSRMDATRAAELAAGTDGVLEILATTALSVDIAIWNPDGSLAELSGNGTRIAAAWLAERTGASQVTVTVGSRIVETTLTETGIEQLIGGVEVGPAETIDGITFVPVSVGNPHAVVVGDPATIGVIGPRLETHARFPERTNVQVARIDGEGEVTARVWSAAWVRPSRRARVPSRSQRRRTPTATSSCTSPAVIYASTSRTVARHCAAPPSASSESDLSQLHEPSVGIAEVRGAAPCVVARLHQELEPSRTERIARRIEIVDGKRAVVLVRRTSVCRCRALVNEDLRLAGGEDSAARPLGHGRKADQVTIEVADGANVVGEERDLRHVRHVAISNSRRTSFSDVLRSVDLLRVPTISAHGRS